MESIIVLLSHSSTKLDKNSDYKNNLRIIITKKTVAQTFVHATDNHY